MSSNYSQ